jgi:outer membrane protein
MRVRRALFWLGLAISLIPRNCLAYGDAATRFTLSQAIDFALAHHPSIRSQRALEEGSIAGVEQARTAYLPDMEVSQMLDQAAQSHNPPGLYLPMPGFPAFEGSRNTGSFGSSAWNSGTSIFIDENVSGLIRQMSLVDAALAKREQAAAGVAAQRLLVSYGAGDAFLAEVAAQQTVRATRAGVERARAFATAVHGLVASGMRPGADESRAQAELAVARNQEIAAEQNEQVAEATLADALGITSDQRVEIVDSQQFQALPQIPSSTSIALGNPFLREFAAGIKSSQRLEPAARYEYLPRLDVVAGLFGRGTGLSFGGAVPGAGSGVLPNSFNWATGVVFTIPIQQLFAARADVHAAEANIRLAKAQYGETALQIDDQIASARATLTGSERIAVNMPLELAAARATWTQNNARYSAGLMTVLDVADAERLLTQAEVDNAVARVNVWRAMLLVSRAAGDLEPFFTIARNAVAGGQH